MMNIKIGLNFNGLKKFPTDDSGEPDWAYMEEYMRWQKSQLLGKYLAKTL